MKKAILLAIVLAVIVGCGASVPQKMVWRPWNRILESKGGFDVGSIVSTSVSGSSIPLLGEQSLFDSDVKGTLDELLMRRGYKISEGNVGFTMELEYRIEESDQLSMSTNQQSYTFQSSAVSSQTGSISASMLDGAYSGAMGVAIASTVARLYTGSTQQVSQTIETKTGYTQTFSLEIRDSNQELLWKAETSWKSSGIDPRNELITVLQILISNLPADTNVIPRVRRLKEDHRDNYLYEYCSGRWFSCPALPYRIYFPVDLVGEFETAEGIIIKDPDFVRNPEALPAFIDLAQTSEYALPTGAKDYDNPVNINLWKQAVLGGTYYLGSSEQPQRVLIKLKGEPSGYVVEECWLASEEEYDSFKSALGRWKTSIKEYFDMFEE